jgi:hypothetical protein
LLIATIGIMGRADALKTEGLVLQDMPMAHVRAGREAELPVISVSSVWMEFGKMVGAVRPRTHKAL